MARDFDIDVIMEKVEEAVRPFPKAAMFELAEKGYDSVDVHVHRITNRWGYIQANTPKKTMAALEETLPQKYWPDINRLLVPFGKHICTGNRPQCSACPIRPICAQVGVDESR